MVRYISSSVRKQRITNLIPVPFNLVGCLEGFSLHVCFSRCPPVQMFQSPALIVMSIAATRMYRSLTDFYNSTGLYAFRHLHSILMLTTWPVLQSIRYLSRSEWGHGEFGSQTDLHSANSARQGGGGGREPVLRGLSADARWLVWYLCHRGKSVTGQVHAGRRK